MSDDDKESGFISHLAELRKRLIYSFIFLIIFFIACYFFAENLYGFLVEPFAKAVKNDGSDRRLIFTALQETFLTYLKVSFFGPFYGTYAVFELAERHRVQLDDAVALGECDLVQRTDENLHLFCAEGLKHLDAAEHLELEAGRRDDDVRLDLLSGFELDARFGELVDVVRDDRDPARADARAGHSPAASAASRSGTPSLAAASPAC